MPHSITIGGDPVILEWSKSSSRLMDLRLSGIGFDWRKDTAGTRMASAMVKICWTLLSSDKFKEYESHEDMYSAMTDDECANMLKVVSEIISEMAPSDEKKSTLTKSHSPESNSA
jgi:hypothetical protein